MGVSGGLAEPNWFAYFPDDYRWSSAMVGVLGAATYGGAEIGEVDRIGKRLKEHVGDDSVWFREWTSEGHRLRLMAEEAVGRGRGLTAASIFLRACVYLQIGERFRLPKDDESQRAYRDGLDCFARYAALTDEPSIELVEIPYGTETLPAYFVSSKGSRREPGPCVVYFDGLDITKELQYVHGVAEIIKRGMSCLIVDGPGNGAAIRFGGLPLRYDYEVVGTAAFDYASQRPDVDGGRIGVMAISLGGYFATRIAAFETRYKACVAWGAIWDYHKTWSERIANGFTGKLSVPGDHIAWVLGVEDLDSALEALVPWRLDGVAQRVQCPYLLLHGEDDGQVPISDANALYDAIGSEEKTLRIFSTAEGGAQHCQRDYLTLATSLIGDWFQDML